MNSFLKSLTLFSTLTLTASAASFPCCPAEEGHGHVGRPDGHGPISVMGDHTHSQGGWMLSYRYMNMQMDGMRSGTSSLSTNQVLAADGGYTVTPESMTMDMHMVGLMYAPSDTLTLMLMANYIETEMDHTVRGLPPLLAAIGDDAFTTQTSGLGDIKLTALYRFYLEDNRKAHFGLGLSLPTGSIDEKDRTPRPGMPPTFNSNQLPAPMQLGSGSFDLLPSLTFVQQFNDWSWGTQASGIIRLNENSNGYRLGHRFEWLGWAGYNVTEWLGFNGGLSLRHDGKLDGDQKDVGQNGPMTFRSVTTAFEDNYGGERLDVILGANLLIQKGVLKGHRVAIDVRLPLWQDLNGYQLETDSVITLGWQKSF